MRSSRNACSSSCAFPVSAAMTASSNLIRVLKASVRASFFEIVVIPLELNEANHRLRRVAEGVTQNNSFGF